MRRWHHRADCQRFWRKLLENRETQTGHASSRSSQSKCSQRENSWSTRVVSQSRQSVPDSKRRGVCVKHTQHYKYPMKLSSGAGEKAFSRWSTCFSSVKTRIPSPRTLLKTDQAGSTLKIPAPLGRDRDAKVGQGGQLAKLISSWFSNRPTTNQV